MSLYDEVQRGNFAAIADLINRGANVNQQSANYEYPLHAAVKNSNKSIVSLLVEKGSNVNCQNANGLTPLHYAAQKGDLDIFSLLNSHSSAREMVKDRFLWTPLHYTCYHGHLPIVEHVVKVMPSLINEADSMGRTPIYLACKFGHLEIVHILLEAGASFLIKDSTGATPFSYLPPIKELHQHAVDREPEHASYAALSSDLHVLFDNLLYSDINFLVEGLPEPNDEGLIVTEETTVHSLSAHRAILQARCPLILQDAPPFRVFSGNDIKISGMTYSLFRAILEFIYCGTITFRNGEIDLDFAFNLAKKGEEYKLPSLTRFSEGLILANLDEETVLSVLEVAESYGCCPHLEYYCRYYILKNFDKIASISPDIQNFTAEHLSPIFKQISVAGPSPITPNFLDTPPDLSSVSSHDPYAGAQVGPVGGDKMSDRHDYKKEGYTGLNHASSAFPYAFNKMMGSKGELPVEATTAPAVYFDRYGPAADSTAKSIYLDSPTHVDFLNTQSCLSPASTVPSTPAGGGLPPPPPAGSDYLVGKLHDAVKCLHKNLMREHDAPDFNAPVEYVLLGLPEYPEIVRRPIDLGTIQKSLGGGAYALVRNWAEDIRLVWDNARIYNSPESSIYQYAERLSNLFESQYLQLQKQFDLPPNYDVFYPKQPEWYINTYNKNLNNYRVKLGLAPVPPDADVFAALPPNELPPPPPKYAKNTPSGVGTSKKLAGSTSKTPPVPVNKNKRKGGSPAFGASVDSSLHKQPPPPLPSTIVDSHVSLPPTSLPPLTAPAYRSSLPLPPPNHVPGLNMQISHEEMEEISHMLVELDDNQSAKLIRILEIQPNAEGEYEISIDTLDSESIRKMLDFLYRELGVMPHKKKKTNNLDDHFSA